MSGIGSGNSHFVCQEQQTTTRQIEFGVMFRVVPRGPFRQVAHASDQRECMHPVRRVEAVRCVLNKVCTTRAVGDSISKVQSMQCVVWDAHRV